MLCIILFVILVFIGVLGAVTYTYLKEIKSGRGAQLQNTVYSGKSAAGGQQASPVFGSVTVNRADLERSDSPYLGASDAPVTVVEFLDLKCPNCAAAEPIMRQVIEKYGSKIKLIVRHFPVESTHPGASGFSEIAWCGQQQGRFWPVLRYFFDHQAELPEVLSETDLATLVGATQLDQTSLARCLATSNAQTAVNRDYVDGAKFGVRATPTFFINGEKVEGTIPFAIWENFLKEQ